MITKELMANLLKENSASAFTVDEIEAIQTAYREAPGLAVLGALFPEGSFSLGVELGRILMGRELGDKLLADVAAEPTTPGSASVPTEY